MDLSHERFQLGDEPGGLPNGAGDFRRGMRVDGNLAAEMGNGSAWFKIAPFCLITTSRWSDIGHDQQLLPCRRRRPEALRHCAVGAFLGGVFL
jgi:hypothetical protein